MNPLIYKQIASVMADIEAITKNRTNSGQGYKFRGIDDVYNELHTHLAKHQVFTVPEVLEERTEERKNAKGTVLIYRVLKIKYTFYAVDGSSISATVIGEGMDSGDKAANKSMAVAHKYALMQVFCIPTEDAKDPEIDSPQVVEKAPSHYTGLPQQKAWLASLLKEKGIAASDMASYHERFLNKTFDDIQFNLQVAGI